MRPGFIRKKRSSPSSGPSSRNFCKLDIAPPFAFAAGYDPPSNAYSHIADTPSQSLVSPAAFRPPSPSRPDSVCKTHTARHRTDSHTSDTEHPAYTSCRARSSTRHHSVYTSQRNPFQCQTNTSTAHNHYHPTTIEHCHASNSKRYSRR